MSCSYLSPFFSSNDDDDDDGDRAILMSLAEILSSDIFCMNECMHKDVDTDDGTDEDLFNADETTEEQE